MSSTQPIQASAFDEAIIQFNSNSMHRKVSTGSVASSTSGESIVDPTDNEPVLLAQEQAEDVAVPATALAAKDAQAIRDILGGKIKTDNHVGVGPFLRLVPEWEGGDVLRRST